jgi:hypothetical protein
VQCVVAGLFAIGALFLPQSPRWLAHVGRDADAARSWERLGYTTAEVEKELEVLQRAAREEATANRASRGDSTVRMLFAKDVRRRTFLGVFLMAMQQVSGASASVAMSLTSRLAGVRHRWRALRKLVRRIRGFALLTGASSTRPCCSDRQASPRRSLRSSLRAFPAC